MLRMTQRDSIKKKSGHSIEFKREHLSGINAKEAALIVEWASNCEDANRAAELLSVLKELGGIETLHELAANL